MPRSALALRLVSRLPVSTPLVSKLLVSTLLPFLLIACGRGEGARAAGGPLPRAELQERLDAAWRAGPRAVGELTTEERREELVGQLGKALVQRAWERARPPLAASTDPEAAEDSSEPAAGSAELRHWLSGNPEAIARSRWTRSAGEWRLTELELPAQGLAERLIGAWSSGQVAQVSPFLADAEDAAHLERDLESRGWENLPPLGPRTIEREERRLTVRGEGPAGPVELVLTPQGPVWLLSWTFPAPEEEGEEAGQ